MLYIRWALLWMLVIFIVTGCRVIIGENCIDVTGIEGVIFNECPDSIAPDPVTDQRVQIRDTTVTIAWAPSTSDDVAEIRIAWSPPDGEVQPKIISSESEHTTIAGLRSNTEYTVRVNAVDASGNFSNTVEIVVTTMASVLFADASFINTAHAAGSAVGRVRATTDSDDARIVSYQMVGGDGALDSDDARSAARGMVGGDGALFDVDDARSAAHGMVGGDGALDSDDARIAAHGMVGRVRATTDSDGALFDVDDARSAARGMVGRVRATTDSDGALDSDEARIAAHGMVGRVRATTDSDGARIAAHGMVGGDGALFADTSFIHTAHAAGSVVGRVRATADSDDARSASHGMVGGDGALFAVDAQTGAISVGAQALNPNISYAFVVRAISNQGISADALVIVAPTDTLAPEPVSDVRATTMAGTTDVVLSWTNSISLDATTVSIAWREGDSEAITGSRDVAVMGGRRDGVAMGGRRDGAVMGGRRDGIAMGGRRVAQAGEDTRTGEDTQAATIEHAQAITISGLDSETEYTFTLVVQDDAIDAMRNAAPNVSEAVSVMVTTPDITAPLPVTNLMATPLVGGIEILLEWTHSKSVDAAMLTIAWSSAAPGVVSGSNTIPVGTEDTATITGLTGTTAYTITITVTDGSGNDSMPAIAAPNPVTTLYNAIDADGDTLIDVNSLERLYNMRYNLDLSDGGRYKSGADTAYGSGMLCGFSADSACTGYELTRDLNFAHASSYEGGVINAEWRPQNGNGAILSQDNTDRAANVGWDPIGNNDAAFGTLFEGNEYTISNLYIRRKGSIGLFGNTSAAAIIRNVGIENGALYEGGVIGSIVGNNNGSIIASYATGTLVGSENNADIVGGLVGNSNGPIIASYAMVNTDGVGRSFDYIGGLAGISDNIIVASYAAGSAAGGAGDNDRVGGLVGLNNGDGIIIASYATGSVSGNGDSVDHVGGLVGENDSGSIIASYATGNADGGSGNSDRVSALVGVNKGIIISSYATGDSDGGTGTLDRVGQLVGENRSAIMASYGFGVVANKNLDGVNDSGDRPDGATGNGIIGARKLTAPATAVATAVHRAWDQARDATADAWDFGTINQSPALRYADYDGAGTLYGCGDDAAAHIVIPNRVPSPSGYIAVTCGSSLLSVQRR